MVDSDGFQFKYVPKEMIITEDQLKKNGGKSATKRERKGTDSNNSGYIYLKKNQESGSDTASKLSEKGNASKSISPVGKKGQQ